MGYQSDSGWQATKSKPLALSKTGKTELGKFDKKPEHPNKTAGIFIAVAINNVFGGSSAKELLELEPVGVSNLLKLVDTIVNHQVDSVEAVEKALTK